jgi:hypothetical protein
VRSCARSSVRCGSCGFLWELALPAYFGAADGMTGDRTPIGNLAYAAVCFVVASLCVIANFTTRALDTASADADADVLRL